MIFFLSCRETKKENINNISQNQITAFESCIKRIDPYKALNFEMLIKENETGFFVIKDSIENKYNCSISYFNNIKKRHNTDNFFYKISKKEFYPKFKILKDNSIIIGNLVQFYGENDIPGVFFQLNMFDKEGKQIDYLIIYNRFSYELVFKYDYQFNNDISEITINQIEEDWLLMNSTGDIIGERKRPILKNTKETYKITTRGFALKEL